LRKNYLIEYTISAWGPDRVKRPDLCLGKPAASCGSRKIRLSGFFGKPEGVLELYGAVIGRPKGPAAAFTPRWRPSGV
jgi:hypothetical protein